MNWEIISGRLAAVFIAMLVAAALSLLTAFPAAYAYVDFLAYKQQKLGCQR